MSNEFLKPDEILKIIDWVRKNSKTPKRDVAIIGLMFDPWGYTGCMRLNEILALDLDPKDVDFDEEIIHIHKVVSRFGIQQNIMLPRDIVMNSKIKEVLLDYIENERLKPAESNPLFVGLRNKKRLNKTMITSMFKNIQKKGGFRSLNSHLLRQSAIAKLVNNPDIDLGYVRRVTGIRSNLTVVEVDSLDTFDIDKDRTTGEGKSRSQTVSKDKTGEILEAIKSLSDDQRMILIKELARS